MPRKPRHDTPGSWHHIMNRGIARRTMFDRDLDVRSFLSQMARPIQDGLIELHAWAILSTHFHLLIRSVTGELSTAMRNVQQAHSIRFNRTRQRDGPLVRGRFRSKLVNSVTYRRALLRYIDANPVQARLVTQSTDYAHGSARWFAQRRGPPWHERRWIESDVCDLAQLDQYDPDAYVRLFAGGLDRDAAYIVERRLSGPTAAAPEFDLLASSQPDVRAWLHENAQLADGFRSASAITSPWSIADLVDSLRATHGPWRIQKSCRSRDGWLILHVGLLRDLACAKWGEIGSAIERSTSNCWNLYADHRSQLRDDAEYERHAASATSRLLRMARVKLAPGAHVG